jgi:hypothetical protein
MMNQRHSNRYTNCDAVISDIENYLDDLGIEDPPSILIPYLQSPKDHREAVQRKLAEAYLRQGQRAVAMGDEKRSKEILEMILVLTGMSSGENEPDLRTEKTQRFRRRKMSLALWLTAILISIAMGVLLTLQFGPMG